jgi:hypothetical protein
LHIVIEVPDSVYSMLGMTRMAWQTSQIEQVHQEIFQIRQTVLDSSNVVQP